jgi:type IV secretion system protein VirB11
MSQFAPQSEGLLAPLATWLEDSEVSEILINRPNEVFIEKNGKFTPFEVPDYDLTDPLIFKTS